MMLTPQQVVQASPIAMPPIRALLLDDNAYDRTRIKRYSEQSDLMIEVVEVPTILEMSAMLDKESFDLILIDYHLPEGTGLDAMQVVQAGTDNKNAPIIMISGDHASSTAISAFRNGCHNFVAKDDLSPVILKEAILNALIHPRRGRAVSSVVETDIQQEIQQAFKSIVDDGTLHSALTDGLRKAAISIGLNTEKQAAENLEKFLASYWDEDEFLFKG